MDAWLHIVLGAVGKAVSVVLTREHGKNDKLAQELTQRSMHCIELPLIEHADGPDRCALCSTAVSMPHVCDLLSTCRGKVPGALRSGMYDWITVTSPEAASVFLEAWHEAGKPKVMTLFVVSVFQYSSIPGTPTECQGVALRHCLAHT
jgi:uroporphyrinogen-III synthase